MDNIYYFLFLKYPLKKLKISKLFSLFQGIQLKMWGLFSLIFKKQLDDFGRTFNANFSTHKSQSQSPTRNRHILFFMKPSNKAQPKEKKKEKETLLIGIQTFYCS